MDETQDDQKRAEQEAVSASDGPPVDGPEGGDESKPELLADPPFTDDDDDDDDDDPDEWTGPEPDEPQVGGAPLPRVKLQAKDAPQRAKSRRKMAKRSQKQNRKRK